MRRLSFPTYAEKGRFKSRRTEKLEKLALLNRPTPHKGSIFPAVLGHFRKFSTHTWSFRTYVDTIRGGKCSYITTETMGPRCCKVSALFSQRLSLWLKVANLCLFCRRWRHGSSRTTTEAGPSQLFGWTRKSRPGEKAAAVHGTLSVKYIYDLISVHTLQWFLAYSPIFFKKNFRLRNNCGSN